MRCSARSRGIAPIKNGLDRDSLTVITATSLEYRIARAELPDVKLVNAGIGLSAIDRESGYGVAISCGLAGGLTDRYSTGTVVIPDAISNADGETIECDKELTGILRESAAALDAMCSAEPLVTTSAIVRGAERRRLGALGFVATDMESALLRARRIAAVRVILDTPSNELHAAWTWPASVVLHPRAWLELPWLARAAPRCARLAARVIRNALNQSRDSGGSS